MVMIGQGLRLLLAIFLTVSFSASSAFTQVAAKGDLKENLDEVRQKKSAVTKAYKAELDKINKAADERMAEIKGEFHKRRDEALKDKKEKADNLAGDYEVKIRPLDLEEKDILQAMVPEGGMNFAKTKSNRREAK